MTKCCAIGCKNVGIHDFPRDAKRREQWEKAVRRKNWKSTKWSRLCPSHFKPEDYHIQSSYTGNENLHKVLKKSVIPSIFSFTKVKPVSPLVKHAERLQRSSRQQQTADTQSLPPNRVSGEKSPQENFKYIYGSIQRYKCQDSVIAFYTGFETYAKFHSVFSTLSPMAHLITYHESNVQNISIEDQFFMTMMKLRQNKCDFELSLFFEISEATVCTIFITWINFMDQVWTKLNIWSEKELVFNYMPDRFKQHDKISKILIDDTVRRISKPSTDRGYNIPTVLKGIGQITDLQLIRDKLGNQRVHIEHLVGLTKAYKILKEELHPNYITLASKIFFVCLICCNFRAGKM